MPYTKTLKTLKAHFPRVNSWSAWDPKDDSLQLAVEVFESTDKKPRAMNLVFLHGAGMSKEVWAYHIDQLFARIGDMLDKIVTFDCVNQNDSLMLNEQKIGWVYDWSDGGRDMNTLLRQLGLTGGNTIAIGHSMGGVSALFAALFEPGLYESLVVIEPVAYFPPEFYTDESMSQLMYDRLRGPRTKTVDVFDNLDDYTNYVQRRSLYRKFDERVLKDFARKLVRKDPQTGKYVSKLPAVQQMVLYNSSVYSLAAQEALKAVSMVRCEVFHVCSTIEDFMLPGTNEIVRKHLRNGKTADIEGGGHIMPFVKPDEFLDIIVPFLQHRHQRYMLHVQEDESRLKLSPEEKQRFLAENYETTSRTFPLQKVMHWKL